MTLVGTNWTVTTLAGLAGPVDSVSADGTGAARGLIFLRAWRWTARGSVIVADMGNYTIPEGLASIWWSWRNHCHSAAKPDRARRRKCELRCDRDGHGANYLPMAKEWCRHFR